jgi:ribonuclease HII
VDGPTFEREEALWGSGCRCIAGVDEVGRGPLAGPVIAAAVVFRPGQSEIDGLRDSKLMTATAREAVAVAVRGHAWGWGIGAASVREIDRINILRASVLAMRRAIARLPVTPEYVLVDGNPAKGLGHEHEAIVGGDNLCLSIAAASVLAKVIRDRLMLLLAKRYPDFRWESNKGYATPAHLAAIDAVGPTAHHRRSFSPVSQLTLFPSGTR